MLNKFRDNCDFLYCGSHNSITEGDDVFFFAQELRSVVHCAKLIVKKSMTACMSISNDSECNL